SASLFDVTDLSESEGKVIKKRAAWLVYPGLTIPPSTQPASFLCLQLQGGRIFLIPSFNSVHYRTVTN
ncbi:MAG: hypothetical protein MUP98_09045, partial [Candidatus Aminicenantes bacterium]|nr:hypothetical protein [Candidatus Aminicenantes bacterium]